MSERTPQLKIRFSEAEQSRIRREAAAMGWTVTQLVRDRVLNHRAPHPSLKRALYHYETDSE